MSKAVRTLAIIAGAILATALILTLVWQSFLRRSFPRTNGRVEIEGLSASVEIYRDEFGVAHIYAETTDDLFFAQGYVHAQERFWQMEFQRRTGAGRLSEIFGEATLGVDKYLRSFGFYHLAEAAYNNLDPEGRKVLDAYAAGVNAYIADRKPAQLGLEFALLELQGVEFSIEPWEPADTLVWAEMMVYDQASIMDDELRNLAYLHAVGTDLYADLIPPYRQDRPVIVPDEELDYLETTSGIDLSAHLTDEELAYLLALGQAIGQSPVRQQMADLGFGLNGGSNSWTISGDLTDTGKPYLANDPHMSINMPSIWYEVGLHCAEKTDDCPYELRGFSLAGVPGLLIGHNDRIAWGLTNASYDAEDVYIERLNPENPNQYEVNGEWVDMEIRREEIVVRDWDEPYVLLIRSTRNGLVASDVIEPDTAGFAYGEDGPQLLALAFKWPALEPVNSLKAIMMLNRAQNYDDFREALSFFDAGKQTFVYADVDGNIGFQYTGKIPIRAQGDGSLPVPGWNDDYQWTGFIPYDDLPRAFNPEQGYIATANHAPVRPENYPYLLNLEFDYGQRARRINDLILADEDGLTLDDLRAIQTDTISLPALEYLPYLKDLEFDDPAALAARDRLLAWDGNHLMDSPEAALFSYFWIELLDATFHDQLPEAVWPDGSTRDHDVMYWLLQEPENPFWDDITTFTVTETRDDILTLAFNKGYAAGVEEFGANLDEWRWGDLHTIFYEHATLGRSGIGLIEAIFNRGPVAIGGSESVIPKTCWDADERDFTVSCHPALRQIIDLNDLSNSLMIQSVGQSGHPGHRHYGDMIEMYRTYQYHPSNWLREAVEADSREHLTLAPAN